MNVNGYKGRDKCPRNIQQLKLVDILVIIIVLRHAVWSNTISIAINRTYSLQVLQEIERCLSN